MLVIWLHVCQFYLHVGWHSINDLVTIFHFSLLSNQDSDDRVTTSKVLCNMYVYFTVSHLCSTYRHVVSWERLCCHGVLHLCWDCLWLRNVLLKQQNWSSCEIFPKSPRTVPWQHYCIYCYYSNWTDLQEVALNPSAVQCLDWGNGQVSERGAKASVKMKIINKYILNLHILQCLLSKDRF